MDGRLRDPVGARSSFQTPVAGRPPESGGVTFYLQQACQFVFRVNEILQRVFTQCADVGVQRFTDNVVKFTGRADDAAAFRQER